MIELYAERAYQFRAIGDPTRLAILELLGQGALCACQLQAKLGIAANLLSHHLKILREAGLVRTEKTGRWVEYRLDPISLLQLHAAIPQLKHKSEKHSSGLFQLTLNNLSTGAL
ncbi:MAG: ArsR/SmtB family transcription factor [Deinococcales bacterium]